MKQFLRKLWKNEEGAEIVEWIVVAFVLIGVAGGVFFLLEGQLNGIIEGTGQAISTAIQGG